MLVPYKNRTKLRKNHKLYCILLMATTNKDLINKFSLHLESKLKTNYYLRGKLEILYAYQNLSV